MLLPVAFGRCDPGHVIINGIIPALMMFPAMAATGKMAFRIWTAAYLAVFVVTSEIGYWSQYIPNFKEGISMHEYYAAHPDQVAAWAAKWEALRLASPHGKDLHWSKVLPFPDGLDQLTSKGRVLMTGDCEGNMWLSRYLLLQKDPPREYFDAFSLGASTPAQLERRVKEDEAYRYLMVPQSAMQMLNGSINLSAYQQSLSNYLSKLLQFPVNSEVKNAPYMPDTEYARRIINDYKPIGKYGSFVILEKKGM